MVFKDYVYTRPDMEKVRAEGEGAIAALANAGSFEEADAALMRAETLKRDTMTSGTLANIRFTLDTSDGFYKGEQEFMDEHEPILEEIMTRFSKALIDSPFKAKFAEKYGKMIAVNAEMDVKRMTPALVPLMQEENRLTSEYQTLASSLKVEFMGETCNNYGLLKHMQSPDRATRKAAYTVWAGWFSENEEKLGALYDKLVHLRAEMGRIMGYDTFTPLGYLNMGRSDYGPEDVKRYRDAVVEYLVPICTDIYRRQAKRIGVDKLKYYDESFMFTTGNATPLGDVKTLIETAKKMYRELSPETGEFFDFMAERELLELDTKPNKAVGGYCTFIPGYDSPFIFSNSNGTADDVGTLTHEGGHAFEAFCSSRHQPLTEYYWSTSEVDEIHSMSMEYFTHPWMKLFFGENTDKYYFEHISSALTFIPYGCCVDEYQHEVYAKPDMTPAERTAVWHRLEKKYLPERDYDGMDVFERGGFWMQKLHIFMNPFYYIDYTLASMGAFEFFGKSEKDRKAAWHDYYTLCCAGGSKPYLELLKLANLSNPFAPGTVEKAVKPMVEAMNKIDTSGM